MNDLIFSPICDEDLKEAVTLHKQYIDYGAGIEKEYEDIRKRGDYCGIKIIDSKNHMIGILIFMPGIIFSTEHSEIETDIRRRYPDKNIYSGQIVAIEKKYRKMHLMKPMFQGAIEQLKAKNVDYVVTELWIHPDGDIPAIKVPTYFKSYEHLYDVEDFYKSYYDKHILCPICGEKCICKAAIYVLEVG